MSNLYQASPLDANTVDILNRRFNQFEDKIAQAVLYPNLNGEKGDLLTPDTFIYQFYPDDVFIERELTYPFRYMKVLNTFLPVGFDSQSGATFYGSFTKINPTTNLIQTTGVTHSGIIPLSGQFEIISENIQTDKFYLTFNPAPTAILSGTWSFAFDKQTSTPILIFFSRNVQAKYNRYFLENNFRFGFKSIIPAAAVTETLQVDHGLTNKGSIKIGVQVSSAANAINFKIYQTPRVGTDITEYDINPSIFPYAEIFTLPLRQSSRTKFEITGGGAGETGNEVTVFFIYQPES